MLAFIGGTGLTRIPNLTITGEHSPQTRWGDASAPVQEATFAGRQVLFLARHGDPHVILPHEVNYRANIQALRQTGATQIVAVNAVGGITADSGQLVIPDQIIDYTWGRTSTFHEGDGGTVTHVDFTWPFDEKLREHLAAALTACALDYRAAGCYAATQGPRLETAAEIRRLERDGCDIVGMTGMPEAVLAREADIPYAMLSLVVNPAAGKTQEEITQKAIETVVAGGMEQVCRVLETLCQQMPT